MIGSRIKWCVDPVTHEVYWHTIKEAAVDTEPKTINPDWLKNRVKEGDMLQFAYVAEDSKAGQPIQQVMMRVAKVDDKHINGFNVMRVLDGNAQKVEEAYRCYLMERIVADTLWIKLA